MTTPIVPPVFVREHASEQGYHQHRRFLEDPCGVCLVAHARYNQQNRLHLRTSHGSLAALERHALVGDLVCEPCLTFACDFERDRAARYYARARAA